MRGQCVDCRHWRHELVEGSRITATRWDAEAGRYAFDYETYTSPAGTQIPGHARCHGLVGSDHDPTAPLVAGEIADAFDAPNGGRGR